MSKAIYSQFDVTQSAWDRASVSTCGPVKFDPNYPDKYKCKRCNEEIVGFPSGGNLSGVIDTEALRDHLITEHLLEPLNGNNSP